MQEKNIKKPKIVEISIFVTIVLFVFAMTAIYNEKTVKTLDEVRKSMKCSSDFVFGIELLIVEKFIKNERQHKKLTNILRDTMKIIDEWRQEDYENGKQEGKEEEKINTAKNMLKENYTIKQIATITQLNIESIKQIKAEFGK